ncbi:hypothetical protein OIU34_14145 [Pararhizobium sp. BT-229]|nr:hypothetical protein [Pararhizobium sp. BT-229]MCV9963046.1 hypothetical protein [Pararhizobium sp. BT-229]
MTIIFMITLSAFILIGLSHVAASRTQERELRQKSFLPVRIHTDRR